MSGAALLTAGCHDNRQPDAIWCETGTGPAQVVVMETELWPNLFAALAAAIADWFRAEHAR